MFVVFYSFRNVVLDSLASVVVLFEIGTRQCFEIQINKINSERVSLLKLGFFFFQAQ